MQPPPKTKPKTHHGDTAQPSRNQKAKPTTEALRHGEKPEKTSCTAEARRRGEEFNFDEKFAQKTRKFEISNTETLRKPNHNLTAEAADGAEKGRREFDE